MVNLWHHLMNKIWIIIHFQQTILIVLPLIYLWVHPLIWIPLKILNLHQTKCRTRIRINSQNKTLLLFWGNVKENLKEISLYSERNSRKNWCGLEKKSQPYLKEWAWVKHRYTSGGGIKQEKELKSFINKDRGPLSEIFRHQTIKVQVAVKLLV